MKQRIISGVILAAAIITSLTLLGFGAFFGLTNAV